MIETLRIEGFCAFAQLQITPLAPVNLIVGRNAVGKTSLLEAIAVLAEGINAHRRLLTLLRDRREYGPDKQGTRAPMLDWGRIFHPRPPEAENGCRITMHGDETRELRIEAMLATRVDDKSGGHTWRFPIRPTYPSELVLRIDANGTRITPLMTLVQDLLGPDTAHPSHTPWFNHGWLPAHGLFAPAMARLYDALITHRPTDPLLTALLTTLRLIVPDAQRIDFLSSGGGEHGGSRLPFVHRQGSETAEVLHSHGQGAVRLLSLALTLCHATGGVFLADEIDNALHPSVLPELWRLIFRLAAENNVQVFATTHRWDCIEAFQHAASEHPSQATLVRINRDERGHSATTYTQAEVATATRHAIEVR